MENRRQGHFVYYTEYHLVISTKYRRKIFNEGVKEYFKVILKRIGEYYPEVKVTEVNTDRDHAHLLVSIPPKIAVRKVYWGVIGIWSDGYFVSTVGITEGVIRKYIQHQGQEDNGQAKLEF